MHQAGFKVLPGGYEFTPVLAPEHANFARLSFIIWHFDTYRR
jgi:hypothetical protein